MCKYIYFMLGIAINNNKHNNNGKLLLLRLQTTIISINLLMKKVGRGSKKYIGLAVYNSKNFKNYIANNNVDDNDINTIYSALVNMKNNTTMSIRNIINEIN